MNILKFFNKQREQKSSLRAERSNLDFFSFPKQQAKSRRLPAGLSDEIISVRTAAQFYNLAKRILNPNEVLRKTGKSIKVFRALEQESQVAACIESRNAGVTSLNWRINSAESGNTDFWDDLKNKIDMQSVMHQILKAPLYGFQPIEICWKPGAGGYVLPDKITAKPQEWFEYTADGELVFLKKGEPDGVIISPDDLKFIIPRSGEEYLNPYGQSVLSRCFWDVLFKKGSKELWMRFAERFGMPFIFGKYEDGMSDSEISALLDSLENLIQDAVAAIPDNSSVEILDASGRSGSADVYEKLITAADRSIAKSILGQTLTTDTGDSGSYALGNVHMEVRKDIIASDRSLCEKYINVIIERIHRLNFGDVTPPPKFEFYEDEEITTAAAERDRILTETGITFKKSYYIKTYGLDESDFELSAGNPVFAGSGKYNGSADTFTPDEAISEAGAEKQSRDFSSFPQQEKKSSWRGQHPSKPAAISKNAAEQSLIDRITDTLSDTDLERLINPKIKAIIDNFIENRDPEDAADALSVLYPEDDSKNLENTMAKALFLAGLIGSSESKEHEKK